MVAPGPDRELTLSLEGKETVEKRIYNVGFEVKISDMDEWFYEDRRVFGDGDALAVVSKTKEWAEKNFAEPYKDGDTGKMVRPKVTGFRLVSITVAAEADF